MTNKYMKIYSTSLIPGKHKSKPTNTYHLTFNIYLQETLVGFLGQEDPGEGIGYLLQYSWASLMAQLVKNPPAMQETWVQSLGWEDSPGEGKGCPLQYSSLENSID